jgi:hypothetical protein
MTLVPSCGYAIGVGDKSAKNWLTNWKRRIRSCRTYHYKYASGHGGNDIVLIDELDMIIVTTADPSSGYEREKKR